MRGRLGTAFNYSCGDFDGQWCGWPSLTAYLRGTKDPELMWGSQSDAGAMVRLNPAPPL